MELIDERIAIKTSTIDWIECDENGEEISQEEKQRQREAIERSAAMEILRAWF